MTEERAIQILEQRECCRECVVENCTCAECDEAFDMAIKALKQEPPKQECKKRKHYTGNDETCLECEYEGITRGYTRYEQEPAYCDRNICLRNEYNGIGCDECEVGNPCLYCKHAFEPQESEEV